MTPVLVPQGDFAGRSDIPLDRPVTTVGSGSGFRLHLQSRSVSKAHALFVNSGSITYVIDLASRGGVLVNSRPVHDAELKTGDRVQIGKFLFRFRAPKSTTATKPAEAPPAKIQIDEDTALEIQGKGFVIGRRESSDLPLTTDPTISTAHAIVFQVDGRWYARDLSSRTGTRINGRSIHEKTIRFGDELRVGMTAVKFQPASVAVAEAAPDEAPSVSSMDSETAEAGPTDAGIEGMPEIELPAERADFEPSVSDFTAPLEAVDLSADDVELLPIDAAAASEPQEGASAAIAEVTLPLEPQPDSPFEPIDGAIPLIEASEAAFVPADSIVEHQPIPLLDLNLEPAADEQLEPLEPITEIESIDANPTADAETAAVEEDASSIPVDSNDFDLAPQVSHAIASDLPAEPTVSITPRSGWRSSVPVEPIPPEEEPTAEQAPPPIATEPDLASAEAPLAVIDSASGEAESELLATPVAADAIPVEPEPVEVNSQAASIDGSFTELPAIEPTEASDLPVPLIADRAIEQPVPEPTEGADETEIASQVASDAPSSADEGDTAAPVSENPDAPVPEKPARRGRSKAATDASPATAPKSKASRAKKTDAEPKPRRARGKKSEPTAGLSPTDIPAPEGVAEELAAAVEILDRTEPTPDSAFDLAESEVLSVDSVDLVDTESTTLSDTGFGRDVAEFSGLSTGPIVEVRETNDTSELLPALSTTESHSDEPADTVDAGEAPLVSGERLESADAVLTHQDSPEPDVAETTEAPAEPTVLELAESPEPVGEPSAEDLVDQWLQENPAPIAPSADPSPSPQAVALPSLPADVPDDAPGVLSNNLGDEIAPSNLSQHPADAALQAEWGGAELSLDDLLVDDDFEVSDSSDSFPEPQPRPADVLGIVSLSDLSANGSMTVSMPAPQPEVAAFPEASIRDPVAAVYDAPPASEIPAVSEPPLELGDQATPAEPETAALDAPSVPTAAATAAATAELQPTGPSIFGFDFDGGSFLGGLPLPLAVPPTVEVQGEVSPAQRSSGVSAGIDRIEPSADSTTVSASPVPAELRSDDPGMSAAPTPPGSDADFLLDYDLVGQPKPLDILPPVAPVDRPELTISPQPSAPPPPPRPVARSAPFRPAGSNRQDAAGGRSLLDMSGNSGGLTPGSSVSTLADEMVVPPLAKAVISPPARRVAHKTAFDGLAGVGVRNADVFSQMARPIREEAFGSRREVVDEFDHAAAAEHAAAIAPVPQPVTSRSGAAGVSRPVIPVPQMPGPAYVPSRSRVPVLIAAMLLLIAATWAGVYFYVPQLYNVTGTLAFKNVELDAQSSQSPSAVNYFAARQFDRISGPEVWTMARSKVLAEQQPLGLLDGSDPSGFHSMLNAGHGLEWKDNTLTVKFTSTSESAGQAQMEAILKALVLKDADLSDAMNRATRDAEDAKAAVSKASLQVDNLKKQQDEQRAIGEDRPDAVESAKLQADALVKDQLLEIVSHSRAANQSVLGKLQIMDVSQPPDEDTDPVLVELRLQGQQLSDRIDEVRSALPTASINEDDIADVTNASAPGTQPADPEVLKQLQTAAASVVKKIKERRDIVQADRAASPADRERHRQDAVEKLNVELTAMRSEEEAAATAAATAKAKSAEMLKRRKDSELATARIETILQQLEIAQSELSNASKAQSDKELALSKTISIAGEPQISVRGASDQRPVMAGIGSGIILLCFCMMILSASRSPEGMVPRSARFEESTQPRGSAVQGNLGTRYTATEKQAKAPEKVSQEDDSTPMPV